jgi:preprotein translocase subunit SecE
VADAAKKTADDRPKALADAPAHRENGFRFFSEVRREASKVTWPTWKETYLTTIVVFVMVGITMVFFFAVDWLLAMGERLLIGAMG